MDKVEQGRQVLEGVPSACCISVRKNSPIGNCEPLVGISMYLLGKLEFELKMRRVSRARDRFIDLIAVPASRPQRE
jgi:hypothetical protein